MPRKGRKKSVDQRRNASKLAMRIKRNTASEKKRITVQSNVQSPALELPDEERQRCEKLIEDEVSPTHEEIFRYTPPINAGTTTKGKPFEIPNDIAEDLADLRNHFIELTPESMVSFVFAVAASENHFSEVKDGVAAAQYHFPNKPIYYYDLGLNNQQIDEVKTWKNVHYRVFNFTQYPDHFISNLRMCGWKPFIIKDILRSHGGVLWMDASVRIHSGDFSQVYKILNDSQGLVLFKSTAHSNFAATHKGTYDYLPTRRKKQKELFMKCAAAMLIYNTRDLFYSVLWWWFLCAYEEKCQMPMPKTMCDFNEERRMEVFANCHKWDQSTINVLLSNYHGYNTTKYEVPEAEGVLSIERWPTNYYDIQTNL